MIPFTAVPIAAAAWIWWMLRIGALALACGLMPVRPAIRALAFAVVALSLPALKDSLLGNVSLLLLLPLVVAWRWMDRPLGSTALAAAMCVRPSLGVFLLWQALRRRWAAATWTVIAGVVLVVATLPFLGISSYRDYLAVLGNLTVPTGLSENHDVGILAMRLGAGPELVGPLRIVGIAVAAASVLISLRRDRELSFMVTLSASLLLVPLLWDHYLATLALPAAFLARQHIAFIALPLLSWVPAIAPLLVYVTMLLPLLVRSERIDRDPGPRARDRWQGRPASEEGASR